MVQYQLKLKLNKTQETALNGWLWNLTGIYNWAIKRIEMDAKNKIYHTPIGFRSLLNGHSKKMEIPAHVIQGTLITAHLAWQRCFKKVAKKPRFKSIRNRLTSIPFPDPFKPPKDGRIGVLGLGRIKYHKQDLPEGAIKSGRIIKRASGWYLCLFIDAMPKAIKHTANSKIGIDPGFKHLITLSTGEKIEHPRELEVATKRLGQAQRGHDKKLAARIQERIANQRKDRNHKLSRQLVSENAEIYFSKDNIRGIAKRFGKSVASSSHGQLRQMLACKMHTSGRLYVEVASKNSTKTCSSCGSLSGPQGWNGLAIRLWVCAICGMAHDRDRNAAVNTLNVGVGLTHERAA